MFFREYLHKNKKLRETVFACSYKAQVEVFDIKKNIENLVAQSL